MRIWVPLPGQSKQQRYVVCATAEEVEKLIAARDGEAVCVDMPAPVEPWSADPPIIIPAIDAATPAATCSTP